MSRLALLSLALIMTSSAYAQRTIGGVRTDRAPTIDGDLSDPAWQQAPKADKFVDPFTGKEVEDQTTAWIAYDDKAIYIAFHCLAKDVEGLIGKEIRPGAAFDGEDFVAVRLDPFGLGRIEEMTRFQVNLLGTQNFISGVGRAGKAEWRGEWKSVAKKVADGYVVEIEIPWAALDYPGGPNKTMAVNFVRWHPKEGRRSLWSNATAQELAELQGRWLEVNPPKRSAPRPKALVYGLGEVNEDRITLDAGLDLRYQPTSQITLVGSANPDFKNVEQSIERLQFARTERFFEDARPFFAEGSSFFRPTSEFGIGRVFYSRRIRDFDFGAKAYGKIENLVNFGALATTGKGRNAGMVRLSHDFGSQGSVGAFAIGDDTTGRENQVLGANFNHRFGNFGASAETAHEKDSSYQAQASGAEVWYQIPRLFSMVRFNAIGPNFNPSLGLTGFNDRRGFYSYTEFADQPTKGPFTRMAAELYADRYDHFDGRTHSHGYDATIRALHKSDVDGRISFEDRVFEGGRDRVVTLGAISGFTNRFQRYSITHQNGIRNDLPFRFTTVDGTQRLFRKLDVGVGFSRLSYQGHSDQAFLTAGWEFDARQSIGARLVKEGRDTNFYMAYRSSGLAGNEFFVIAGDPNAKKWEPRLTIKVVMPFDV